MATLIFDGTFMKRIALILSFILTFSAVFGRDLSTPNPGDCAVIQRGSDNKWHYQLFQLDSAGALTLAGNGAMSVVPFATAAQGTKADTALQGITIGTVSTGNAAVSASTSGTSTTLNFVVPQGSTGATGSTGSTGGTGATGSTGATGTAGANGTNGTNATTTSTATGGANGLMSSTDKSKLDAYPAYAARSFTNTPSHTIQTVAASANGWQLSSTRDADVYYSCTTSTTATIGGASTATVVLEICATNSATAANWITVATASNSQTITLAIALQSVQVNTIPLSCTVPAGYFVRLRDTLTGTASASFVSGQEVLK